MGNARLVNSAKIEQIFQVSKWRFTGLISTPILLGQLSATLLIDVWLSKKPYRGRALDVQKWMGMSRVEHPAISMGEMGANMIISIKWQRKCLANWL